MKLYLMIGQSNMAGRGEFGEVPEIRDPRLKMMRNGRFQTMTEPIVFDRIMVKNGKLLVVGTAGELMAQTGTDRFENAFISIVKEADV